MQAPGEESDLPSVTESEGEQPFSYTAQSIHKVGSKSDGKWKDLAVLTKRSKAEWHKLTKKRSVGRPKSDKAKGRPSRKPRWDVPCGRICFVVLEMLNLADD